MPAVEFAIAEIAIVGQRFEGMAELLALGAGDETAPVAQFGELGAKALEHWQVLATGVFGQLLQALAQALMKPAGALEGAAVEQLVERAQLPGKALGRRAGLAGRRRGSFQCSPLDSAVRASPLASAGAW